MDDTLFLIVELSSIGLAVGLFFVGRYSGAKDKNEQLEQFVKALNIDRWLDGRTKGDPSLFVEEGIVKGKITQTVQVTGDIQIVDWERKKMRTIGEKTGERDLTSEEIKQMTKERSTKPKEPEPFVRDDGVTVYPDGMEVDRKGTILKGDFMSRPKTGKIMSHS